MNSTGFIDLPEGKLHWVIDRPQSLQHSILTRPTLLFIHAGVADLTLWDDQASYFTTRGWSVLRYDLFGYGQSLPNAEYLDQNPRPLIKHYEHAKLVVQSLSSVTPEKDDSNVVVIGLSRGGAIAIDFATAHPNLISGIAVVAGGLSGFDCPNDPLEDEMFAQDERLYKANDVGGAAQSQVRIWGDGPLQKEGRLTGHARTRLHTWCRDIAARECAGTGGLAIPCEDMVPPASERLPEIKVPVAVALGKLDESSTIAAMRHVAEHASNTVLEEFDAAHMVNLEFPDKFNRWLESWLNGIVGQPQR